MMLLWEIGFWSAAALVAYTYVGYPLLIAVLARLRPQPVHADTSFAGSVSIVLCVHNEEKRLTARLAELVQLLAAAQRPGEIIVVSDGSTDGTAELARHYADERVRVIELPANVGKAAALSQGVAAAQHDILVFADVRQRWDAQALEHLLRNFADPRIGGVSGELVLESAPGVLAGVGLYWRYEKWLRRQESRLHSQVGVTGAICAVRRSLFRPIPPGTLLDDVYWPLCVVMQGYRVVHDRTAQAFDCLPDKPRDEFRRKVRTLSGNYQLLTRLPTALLPWCNPVWFAFLSHKILRLAVPWALLVMLLCCLGLATPLYLLLLTVQLAGYLLGLLGLTRLGARGKLTAAAGSFLVLNTAAWLAFWVWLSGRAGRSWSKVQYNTAAPLAATPSP